MAALITLSIGISVLGFSFMFAGLIYMARQLGEARASTERIAMICERIEATDERIALMQQAMWAGLRRQFPDIDQDV